MAPVVRAQGRPAGHSGEPAAPSLSHDSRGSRESRAPRVPGFSAAAGPTGVTRPSAATGQVQSWDLVGGEYGPGTRFVLFTAGCPLRCVYCSAPQTWDEQAGQPVTVAEVMTHVQRYLPLFDLTGGGVTLSGGEPLMQPGFVSAVLRACRADGVRTALDTSGASGAALDDATLADIDLTLLDLKAYHADTYARVCGGDVAPSLRLARRLADTGRPIRVRFVLVPGLTDADRDVEALAEFVAGLGTVERVDVVPFHRRGESGWNALGLSFPLAVRPGPTHEALATVREAFSRRGLLVG
jgi:pyruvate formate lyase activating enzyme